jgi:hypothetical protein
MNYPLFCELSSRSVHFQISIETIQRPSRIPPGALSLVDALRSTNCPRPTSHSAGVVRCEATAMRARERRLVGRCRSGRDASAIGVCPEGTTGCGQATIIGANRENPSDSAKSSEIGGGRSLAFEPIMIGRSAFCGEQHFYSSVIVVPIHGAKFSRIFKKLTESSWLPSRLWISS